MAEQFAGGTAIFLAFAILFCLFYAVAFITHFNLSQ